MSDESKSPNFLNLEASPAPPSREERHRVARHAVASWGGKFTSANWTKIAVLVPVARHSSNSERLNEQLAGGALIFIAFLFNNFGS